MSPFKNPGDLIGAILLSVGLYVLTIAQGASQSPDNVSIPRATLDRLDRAINGLVDAMRDLKSAPASPRPTAAPPDPPQPPATPAALSMDGRWVTQWPRDTILITSGQLDDPRYHNGQLNLEGDGTYRLSAYQYPACYYNISMSADRNAMSWTPAMTVVPASVCRPATTFYLTRDTSEPPREPYPAPPPYRESDCCAPHRVHACCERPHVQDCCERPRIRVRHYCCERPRMRDCCGERVRRAAPVWRWRPPPRDLCERWEPEDGY
jgi:hypothetical protein